VGLASQTKSWKADLTAQMSALGPSWHFVLCSGVKKKFQRIFSKIGFRQKLDLATLIPMSMGFVI